MRDLAKKRAYDATYRATHREEVRITSAKWYAAHQSERRAYSANWRKVHPAYRAKWGAEHPDYYAKWREEHREERRACLTKWYAEHPEERRAYGTDRYHRKRANGGHFPRAAWEHLKALFGHTCAYCHRRMERLTQDHIVPISKGGWHVSFNIVPACQSCNSRKGARI